jgi:hypothetical protein
VNIFGISCVRKKIIKEESGVLVYWFNKVKGKLEVYQ